MEKKHFVDRIMGTFIKDAQELPELPTREFKERTASLLCALFELHRDAMEDYNTKVAMLTHRVSELMRLHPKASFADEMPGGFMCPDLDELSLELSDLDLGEEG